MALVDPSQLDLLKPKKKPKYKNKKCVVDGIKFDSEKEAYRWPLLQELERQGKIKKLRRQVPYRLYVNGTKICKYVADYCYESEGEVVVEDAKGYRTRVYIIKARLMLAIHGIVIKEV